MRYYDRAGKPITLERWCLLFEDKRYQILRQTEVSRFTISTIWLGIDHRFFGDGPPLIFETMIMNSDAEREDLFLDEQYRYATEQEALAHHEALVEQVRLFEEATTTERSTNGTD